MATDEKQGNKILVTKIPGKTSRDKLFIHFQRQRNGGGDVSAVVYPKSSSEPNSAVVKFDEAETVKSVLKHGQLISRCEEEVEVSEFPAEIFDSVTTYTSDACNAILAQSNEVFDQLAEDLGVQIVREGERVKFEGEWFQTVALSDRLQDMLIERKKNGQKIRDDSRNTAERTHLRSTLDVAKHDDEPLRSAGSRQISSPNEDKGALQYEIKGKGRLGKHEPADKGLGAEVENKLARLSLSRSGGSERQEGYGNKRDEIRMSDTEEPADKRIGVNVEKKVTRMTLRSDGSKRQEGHAHITEGNVKSDFADPQGELSDQHVINADKDILSYLKIEYAREINDIFETYHVTSTLIGDCEKLTFHPSYKGSDPEEGITRFQKIYLAAQDGGAAQGNYNIPPTVDSNRINKAIIRVKTEFPRVVISKMTDAEAVIFIAATMRDCEDARQTFASYIEGNRNQRNYASVAAASGFQTSRHEKSEKFFEFIFPTTHLKVLVVRGDIASQEVDAIVNAANARLDNGGGVTGAIFRAGGWLFENECVQFMSKRKSLAVGEVVHTKAYGDLRCKDVIHVTGPMWSTIFRSCHFRAAETKVICEDIMENICKDLIKHANKIGATSVAIPAISTGIYGVPLEIFCGAMTYALERYQKLLPKKMNTLTLREIRLVNFNVSEAQEIASNLGRWRFRMKIDTEV